MKYLIHMSQLTICVTPSCFRKATNSPETDYRRKVHYSVQNSQPKHCSDEQARLTSLPLHRTTKSLQV